MKKTGIAIITYNRPQFYKECRESIDDSWADKIITVNDGDLSGASDRVILTHGIGVTEAKNIALKQLLDRGMDYIFLVEDDMKFIGNVFNEYIKAHEVSGIHHFTFGYHGSYNMKNGKPNPRKVIEYNDGIKVALNTHSVGAVAFFTRESLKDVGLFDPEYSKFGNAFDHVDHSYRLAKAGYSTPYWWWADLENSYEFIKEQGDADTNSTVRNDSEWINNVKQSAMYFKEKHRVMPAWNDCVPNESFNTILKQLKTMKNDRPK